ncbi:MAG: hypothetical protein U0X39_14800 [Bacteroidales bacterium]
MFNRVELNLNDAIAPDLPIDRRLKNYTDSVADFDLESLYFQFGRYLLISSSRTEESRQPPGHLESSHETTMEQ